MCIVYSSMCIVMSTILYWLPLIKGDVQHSSNSVQYELKESSGQVEGTVQVVLTSNNVKDISIIHILTT